MAKTLYEKTAKKHIRGIKSRYFYSVFNSLLASNTKFDIYGINRYKISRPILLYKFRSTNKCFNECFTLKRNINSQSQVRYKKQALNLKHKSIIYYQDETNKNNS